MPSVQRIKQDGECRANSIPLTRICWFRTSRNYFRLALRWRRANIWRKVYYARMDEGRKRVIAIIAGIIMARNLDRADDLFGGPQGSPRTDKMIAAAVQWAERIMQKVDSVCSDEKPKSVAQKA
jgi:hypothetical protein